MPKKTTAYAKFYYHFVHWMKIWDYSAGVFALYFTATTGVCMSANAISKICKLTAKNKKECALPIYHEIPTEYHYTRTQRQSCATDTEKEKLFERYAAASKKNAALFDKLEKLNKSIGSGIKPLAKALKQAASLLKPLQGPLNKAKPAFKVLDKAMKPLKIAMNQFKKAWNKKICIRIKKLKLKGCMRISRASKQLKKLAKPLQKPMEKAISKILNPIIKKISKAIKIPGTKAITNAASKLEKLNFFSKLKEVTGKFQKTPFLSHVTALVTLRQELQAIQAGLQKNP